MTDGTPGIDQAQAIVHLRKQVADQVAMGYDAFDTILANAIDAGRAMDAGVTEAHLRAMIIEEIRSHAATEATWTLTDNDRFDAACATLEKAGIMCRQNFACCMTCGNTEIWEEMEALEARGASLRGYAYFHEQDAQSAGEGYGVMLAFGANVVRYDPEAAEAVARDIVKAMREQRLETRWRGEAGARIHVRLNWKRRRSTLDADLLAA